MSDCIPLSSSSAAAPAASADGSATAAVSPAVIDLVHLNRYTMGDAALEREILGLFADQLALSLEVLRTADRADAWLRAAHTLRGSAGAVGAVGLATSLQEAEKISSDDDATGRQTALVRIEAEAREVLAFLKSSHI